MKTILTRLALAAAITLAAFAVTSDAQQSGNQQPDEDRTPVSPRQQQPPPTPKSPTQTEAPKPAERSASAETNGASNDDQTQNALTFTGRLEETNGTLILHDPVTKMTYGLDDPSKARAYLGKQVKVIGKLGMRSNTIHIDSVEVMP